MITAIIIVLIGALFLLMIPMIMIIQYLLNYFDMEQEFKKWVRSKFIKESTDENETKG